MFDFQVPVTFSQTLVYIGSVGFIGILVSVFFKKWAWFQVQPKNIKVWIVLGVCLFFPILSRALTLYLPPDFIKAAEAWWPTITAGLGMFASSQVYFEFQGNQAQTTQLTIAHIGEKKDETTVTAPAA